MTANPGQALAPLISDYGQFEAHDTFVSRLRPKHSRKSGFWTLITDPTTVTASRSGRAECMLTPARQRLKGGNNVRIN